MYNVDLFKAQFQLMKLQQKIGSLLDGVPVSMASIRNALVFLSIDVANISLTLNTPVEGEPKEGESL